MCWARASQCPLANTIQDTTNLAPLNEGDLADMQHWSPKEASHRLSPNFRLPFIGRFSLQACETHNAGPSP